MWDRGGGEMCEKIPQIRHKFGGRNLLVSDNSCADIVPAAAVARKSGQSDFLYNIF